MVAKPKRETETDLYSSGFPAFLIIESLILESIAHASVKQIPTYIPFTRKGECVKIEQCPGFGKGLLTALNM